MIYQFEHDEIKHCYECPLAETGLDDMNFYYGYCSLSKNIEWSEENVDDDDTPKPDDCPLVVISKTETASCEWCELKTIPLFYVECVRATLDDESQLISASYCPACGRKLD